MIVLKKKILTSLLSATILLSTVAPVVSTIYADEDVTDQTTEPEIPSESNFPIEEIPDTGESTHEEENSTEQSEDIETPEETSDSSSIEEPTIPDESTFPEGSEESQQSDESTENNESEETTESTQENSSDIESVPVKPINSAKEKLELKDSEKVENSKANLIEEKNTTVRGNKTQYLRNKSEEKQKITWIANQPEDIEITPDDTEYIIQWGDTLWAISIKAETTIDDIARLNNIQNMDLIFAGDILVLK